MDPNVLASEKCAVVGTVDPATVTALTYTDAIDMSKFRQALGIALFGNMTDGNDCVFAAYACNAAGNARSAIKTTTKTAAAGNDNTQVVIGVRAEDLLAQSTYTRYVQFGISNAGGAGGPAAVVALGIDPINGPASDDDLSSVTINNTLD
jgi:hypothetical protein